MKHITDLTTLRELLARYYDSQTTPDEERRLEQWAAETPESALPADLRADAAMLRDLSAARTASLVNGMIDRLDRTRRLRVRRWRICGATAAACVAIAIGFAFRPSQPAVSPASADGPAPLVAQTVVTEPLPESIQPTEPATPAVKPARKPKLRSTLGRKVASAPREVVDSAEAQAMISDVLRLVASSVRTGRQGIGRATEKLDETMAHTAAMLNES